VLIPRLVRYQYHGECGGRAVGTGRSIAEG